MEDERDKSFNHRKTGVSSDKIMNYLGQEMNIDLKNHHRVTGTMVFYHITEQMIHLSNWTEYTENGDKVRQGKYMVINRTAWFQLYQ